MPPDDEAYFSDGDCTSQNRAGDGAGDVIQTTRTPDTRGHPSFVPRADHPGSMETAPGGEQIKRRPRNNSPAFLRFYIQFIFSIKASVKVCEKLMFMESARSFTQ